MSELDYDYDFDDLAFAVMDSDNSMDGEEARNGNIKNWENRANSDVSDDENFSRGAKSIDSPPESPPRGGGNLDSPPASPAQGVESPHSAYSGSSRSSQGSRGSSVVPRAETPQSPARNHRSPSPDQANDTPASSPIRSPPNMESPRSSPERMCPRTPPESPGSSPGHRRPKTPEAASSPEGSRGQGQRDSPLSSPGAKSPNSSPGRKSMSNSPERRSGARFERLRRSKISPSPPSSNRRRPLSGSSRRRLSPSSRLLDAPDSPASSDDGRSNISSNSSLGSHKFGSPKKSPPPPAKIEIKSHGEDLSDVSDIESIGSELDQDPDQGKKNDDDDKKDKGSVSGLNPLEEAEQLDFEAEEEPKPLEETKPEEPACDASANGSKKSSEKDVGDDEEEGEVKELEDGEITDEGENRPEETEPRPVCRFFSRGQCTWGSSCRLRHEPPTPHDPFTISGAQYGDPNGPGSSNPEDIPPHLPPAGPILPSPQPQGLMMGSVGPIPGGVFIQNFHPMRGHPRFFRGCGPWLRPRGGVRFFGPRFVHPGVTDKGNYTMFDMVRPLVAMNSGPPPPMHVFGGPMDPYGPRPMERPMMGPAGPPFQQPMMRRDEPPGESAWERGLRQAKEMLRRSTKRKETDVDFEEKKMNLSLAGTDEYDKENDYYTRPASPIYPDEPPYHDRYPPPKEAPAPIPVPEKRYRSVSDRFGDYPPPQYYPPGGGREQWYDDRAPGRYHHHSSRHPPDYDRPRNDRGRGDNSVPPDDYYDGRSSRKKYSSREVTVQRSEKSDRNYRDISPSPRPRGSDRTGSVRGDEWSDPWMRSKSPMRKGRPTSRSRKKSYSSRSSYSTSSSSRSSSYSSYSRSRSRSRSSRSRSVSRSRSRSSFTRRKPSPPLPKRNKSPFSRGKNSGRLAGKDNTNTSDRRLDAERSLHMNPPAPSPRSVASPPTRKNPTPPSDRSSRNLSARILAAAIRDRSRSSSRSSTGSESSGSSSESSSDSGSSSSSRSPSPAPRVAPKAVPTRKKIEIDEKLAIAQAMKAKAMDALKLSGQKQQIKLTLKGNSERAPQPVAPSRKRVAESPVSDEADEAPAAKKKASAPASRREELLKQLKAVEDAIARKRSKT